ncbi:hypothetical protein [Nitrosopumilus sp.]|uniref:hypothetical protein n=1 Tax=Nitrosopumilus sp. TaxID=2024843 RepID=UPI003B5B4BC9
MEPGSDKIQIFEIKGSELKSSKKGQFYTTSVFQFGGNNNKLTEGITINRLTEDVEISIGNKTNWFMLLKIFSNIARYGREGTQDKKGMMVTVSHEIPYPIIKDFMQNRPLT